MTLLVTGATGFVMSVLARHWLDAFPDERVAVLDAAAPDAAALRYFASVADRLDVVVADVTHPAAWQAALAGADITHIVHGATLTPLSRGTAAEAKREPEAENPGRIIDVNVMGTVAVLEGARAGVGAPSAKARDFFLWAPGRGINAPRPGAAGGAAAGGRLCDAAAPL